MKTAIYTSYVSPEVIQVVDSEKPSPKPNEVLVRIKASSANRAYTMMRAGTPKFGRLFIGLFKPKNTSLGTGFSGIINLDSIISAHKYLETDPKVGNIVIINQ